MAQLRLRSLKLSDCPDIDGKALTLIAEQWPGLTDVDLKTCDTKWVAVDFQCLGGLKDLSRLSLRQMQLDLDERVFSVLARSLCLTDLTLTGLAGPGTGLAHIKHLALVQLSLRTDGQADYQSLESFTQLRYLTIEQGATDATLSRLRGMTLLHQLRLFGNPEISNRGARHLLTLPSLRDLRGLYHGSAGPGRSVSVELDTKSSLPLPSASQEPGKHTGLTVVAVSLPAAHEQADWPLDLSKIRARGVRL